MIDLSPKRTTPQSSHWFGYYAGYSPAFVRQAIKGLGLEADTVIADPWNGSGTTTEAAYDIGLAAHGFDINPAIVLVARARMLRSDVRPSHISLCDSIIAAAQKKTPSDTATLSHWFNPDSAQFLRAIEIAIHEILVGSAAIRPLGALASVKGISSLAAFFYVALFRTVRTFLAPYLTSNPTWIKIASSPQARVRPRRSAIAKAFRANIKVMFTEAPVIKRRTTNTKPIRIDIGDSASLPLGDDSVDAVISSPPYCTRIDYAVATRPELAALGFTDAQFDRLRANMLGTSLTLPEKPAVQQKWGERCLSFLESIRTHESHASSTYYYSNHLQYFDKLYKSLGEIARVLKQRGLCALVVQDSYYKGLHNDLQGIVIDMAATHRLVLRQRVDHRLRNTKVAVNTRSRVYRQSIEAIESVLVFQG